MIEDCDVCNTEYRHSPFSTFICYGTVQCSYCSAIFRTVLVLRFNETGSLYIYPRTTHSLPHSLICMHKALLSHLKLVPGFLLGSRACYEHKEKSGNLEKALMGSLAIKNF